MLDPVWSIEHALESEVAGFDAQERWISVCLPPVDEAPLTRGKPETTDAIQPIVRD